MKRILSFALLLSVPAILMGMAANPDQSIIKIPKPAANFRVTIVDQSDVSTGLERFSCDGQTFFLGKKGLTEFAVDFEQIRSASFFLEEHNVRADLVLKNGETLVLSLKPRQPCFGVSAYGNVRIETRDIKSITFSGRAPDS